MGSWLEGTGVGSWLQGTEVGVQELEARAGQAAGCRLEVTGPRRELAAAACPLGAKL